MGAVANQIEILSVYLLSGATGTGASPAFDKGPYNNCTLQIRGTGATTNTATAKIEGSLDGTNWYSIPYRTPSSDTSSNSNVTVTDAQSALFYLDPKYVRYVRVNVSANASAIPIEVLATAVF